MITLNIEPRGDAKNSDIRSAGKIPAVFYGPKEKTTSIAVSLVEFGKVLKKAGESSVVVLKDGAIEHETLIYAVDVHPVTGVPRHVDFYVIEKGKKVQVDLQLTFTGVSPAVKDLGGILVKVIRELKIEAAPKDLPHELLVDISSLVDLTSVIHVRDLKIAPGVTVIDSLDDVVASIAEAKEEVEEVKPVDMSTIEVEKKGKEAKEGGEAGEGEADAKDGKKEEKKG